MNENAHIPADEVNFQKLFGFLELRWKRLLFVAVVGAALGAALKIAFPKYKASGEIYISDKETGTLASALGDVAGSAGSIAMLGGKKGVSLKYSFLLSSDDSFSELSAELMQTPGYLEQKPAFEEKYARYETRIRKLGLEPSPYEKWFAEWCSQNISFFASDPNVIQVQASAVTPKFVIDIVNTSLGFAKNYSIKRETSDIHLAKTYLEDRIIKIETALKEFSDNLLQVRSTSAMAGAMSPSGFYDSGIGVIRNELDMAVSQLDENIRVAKRLRNSRKGAENNIDTGLQIQQIESANEILKSRIATHKSMLQRKQGDKDQLLKQLNIVETVSRQVEIYADSYKLLQDQALKIDLLAMTVPNRFQITVLSGLDRTRPAVPGPLAVLLGALLCTILYIILEFIVSALNPRVLSKESAKNIDFNFVAYMQHLKGSGARGILLEKKLHMPDFSRTHPGIKALLSLRRSVQNFLIETSALSKAGAKLILVSGPSEGNGKTTIANGLAMALANAGERVLIADLDPYHPQTSTRYGLKEEKGLYDILSSSVAITEKTIKPLVFSIDTTDDGSAFGKIDILPAGLNRGSFVKGMETRLSKFIETFSQSYDYIVIDLPPLLETFEFSPFYTASDLTLLVCRHNKTLVGHLEEAYEVLPVQAQRKVALVINDVKTGIIESQASKLRTSSYYYQKRSTPAPQAPEIKNKVA